MATKVFLGSIPQGVSGEELRAQAAEHGTVAEFYFNTEKVHQNRGWAFVSYATSKDAERAIQAMNGKMYPGAVRGIEARIAEAKGSRPQQNPGGGGGGMQMHQQPQHHPQAQQGQQQMQPPPQHYFPPPQAGVWQQYFTEDGHAYYYHTITGSVQWERPPDWNAVPQPQVYM